MNTREVAKRGRPLAFLATLGIAWIGLRLAVLAVWPDVEKPVLAQAESTVQVAQVVGERVQPQAATDGRVEPKAPKPTSPTDKPSVLDAPPPAHLKNGFDPLPAAAAHNALWMNASSGFDAALSPPVTMLGKQGDAEEF